MAVEHISGLKRIEAFSRDEMGMLCMDETRSVYPHKEVYGQYCTIEEYIDCPPEKVFEYLSHTRSLEEWTWSTRGFESTDTPDLYKGYDRLADDTPIYCKTLSNREAMTVDYHCAWDQGSHLWMIYLMRVIPAQLVFNKPGSVVLWSNCKHPFYENNPFPETASQERDTWVGDLWPFFRAGHVVEMLNLKKILEHRHAHGETLCPWLEESSVTNNTTIKAA